MTIILVLSFVSIFLLMIAIEIMVPEDEILPPHPQRRTTPKGRVTIGRAREIERSSACDRERQEARLEELCQFFGVTMACDSPIPGWVMSVVRDGTMSLSEAMEKVSEYRKQLRSEA